MGDFVGFEFDGALQRLHGRRGRGGGQAAVEKADEDARGGAERGDLVVPATEDVVGPGVARIEREGALGLLPHEPRVLDAGLEVAVDGEFAVRDSQREDVFGVARFEGDGAPRVVEGALRVTAAGFVGGEVDDEVGVLPRDFLQDAGVIGPGAIRGEVELKGAAGIEAILGGVGGGQRGFDVGAGRGPQSGGQQEGEYGEPAEPGRVR